MLVKKSTPTQEPSLPPANLVPGLVVKNGKIRGKKLYPVLKKPADSDKQGPTKQNAKSGFFMKAAIFGITFCSVGILLWHFSQDSLFLNKTLPEKVSRPSGKISFPEKASRPSMKKTFGKKKSKLPLLKGD
eukprot:GHVP01024019.1.p2 GENE.GHVP01024019.1~~GHVP01024019.1.p2  ORF type:complete len:131 (-),score=28.09 GHVP01024019.1:54-446(-)